MAIKQFVQTDLRIAPTAETHVVRLKDMLDYVNGLTSGPARAIMTEPFAGAYSASALTLTQSAPEALVVDGVTLAVGDRVLVAAQLDKTQNGMYTLEVEGDSTTAAVLKRAADMSASAQFKIGLIVPVDEGDVNAGTRWKILLGSMPFVMDSATVEFIKASVDVTRVCEQTFELEGDDATIVYNCAHNWDTMNVTHEIYDSEGNTIIAEFKRVSPYSVSVAVGAPLGIGNDLTLILRAEVEPA